MTINLVSVCLIFQINRNFDLKCFLYTNNVFINKVQYEFEACMGDKVGGV